MTTTPAPASSNTPMNLLNIRSLADARVFVQTAAPVVATMLVTYGYVSDEQATLWVAFALALVAPAIAALNTAEGFRRWFYGVLGAANAIAVAYGAADPEVLGLWLPIVSLVLGGASSGIANANTNTSPSTERNRHTETAA